MKRATKFTTLILIASMIFYMITPLVHAEELPSDEENNKFSITIKNSNSTHKFKAYQIFKGRVDKEQHRLSDIAWGKDIDAKDQNVEPKTGDKESLIEVLKKDEVLKNTFSSVSNARSVAKALDGITDNSKEAIRFAEIVNDYLKSDGGTDLKFDESSKTHKADDLEGGYYLIKDTADISPNNATTRYILELSQDQDVNVKSGTTSVEKLVRRANTTDEFKKAVSAEMGGEVEFQLTGTLPDNYSDYSKYYYSFIDTLPKGLDYVKDSAKIFVVNKKESSEEKIEIQSKDFKVEGKNENDKKEVIFKIEDLKKLELNSLESEQSDQEPKITKDSKIVLTFKAKLNKDAVIGSAGNINKVQLEYSSNPNKGHEEEKTKTTEDEAAVYTYELEIEKEDKDESGKKLKGVGFKLYKKVKQDEDDSEKKLYAKSDGSNITEWTENREEATTFTTDDNGQTNIKGLSSGVYYLTETKFLPRYDSIGDIEITIKEVFGDDKDVDPPAGTVQEKEKLRSLTFSIEEVKSDENSESAKDMVKAKENVGNVETGKFSITIYNKKGSLLPKTGGIGTIIFYVLGIGLIILAVYLIYSKKKK